MQYVWDHRLRCRLGDHAVAFNWCSIAITQLNRQPDRLR